MEPETELELYSTEELIAELLSRTTFQGLILRRTGDFRGEWQDGPNHFQMSFNNLEREEALRLMVVFPETIQRVEPTGDSDD